MISSSIPFPIPGATSTVAGADGAGHVPVAELLTRSLLSPRSARFTKASKTAFNPIFPSVRPEAFLGESILHPGGLGQTLSFRSNRRTAGHRFEARWKNAAPALRDSAFLTGSPGNRTVTVSWFETEPVWTNRSAEILAAPTRRHVPPGEGRSIQILLRKSRAYRGNRFFFSLIARSSAEPSAIDQVRGGIW